MARYAYADPPYIGCAGRYVERQEIDHADLIQNRLSSYDGWALSCHTQSLRLLLPICPNDTRVMAWVKPFAVFKPNVNPAYAWEPVLIHGARKHRNRQEPTTRDWVAANTTLRKGIVGAKPPEFCYWLFNVLGLLPDDSLDDLFPGTGIVMHSLDLWRGKTSAQPLQSSFF